jgi:hypothetical protein
VVTRDQIRDPNPNGKLLTGVVVSSLLRDTMSAPPGAESCMLTMRTGRGVGLWPPVKGESSLWCRCLDLLAVKGAARGEVRGGPSVRIEHDVSARRVEGGAWGRVRWSLEEPGSPCPLLPGMEPVGVEGIEDWPGGSQGSGLSSCGWRESVG